MNYKIALISDIHGNYEAIKSVVEDAERSGVTEYWLLGDILLPGPGSENILALLDQLPITVKLRGNWDDCLLEALNGKYTTDSTEDIYLLKLTQFLEDKLSIERLAAIREMPLSAHKMINGLNISISHNLPTQNWGGYLIGTNDTKNFDELFSSSHDDIAIFAHIHQPLLRYSSQNQLIINPGSVGQPYYLRERLRKDLRAQYAILNIDEQGYSDILFKKVDYNRELELSFASNVKLPFLELYQELLKTGVNKDKDRDRLQKVIDKYHYKRDIEVWMKQQTIKARQNIL